METVPVIISIISAMAAISSAIWAWRQNQISGMIAILNNHIEKRNDLVWILDNIQKSMANVLEGGVAGIQNNPDYPQIGLLSAQIKIKNIAAPIMHHRYFFNKTDISALDDLLKKIDQCKTMNEFVTATTTSDDIFMRFYADIIPPMLNETQKRIEQLEKKVGRNC